MVLLMAKMMSLKQLKIRGLERKKRQKLKRRFKKFSKLKPVAGKLFAKWTIILDQLETLSGIEGIRR